MKKVILITGASSGMGKVFAQDLAKEGHIVYGAARRTDLLNDLSKQGVQTISLDVTDDESMKFCVQTILEKEGRIDVLVNNAGYGSYGTIEDVSMEEAKRQLDVNVFGLARMTQLVLPGMRKQKSGKIINISSIGGKIATPFGAWYHASKFAVEGMSDSLRLEVAPFGIDVVVIEPGGVKSEWATIAYENLIKTTENTAYKDMADKFKQAFEKTIAKNAEPQVISRLVSKAISAKRPKTRYVGGYMAKPALFFRKWLGDRTMDKVLLSQLPK
ncbi:oxidoreductase [Fluviicola chungangensis]|uniref:Oxidoreductase n=1 Tax=Fluviicola chungangensis TaxID=2597671 RepID=A0A556MIW7_9FLAO|nr:oxidoreductase [Fluviicola chungangensis]TSJ39861.1 oxidoreductase [Fluviicola chungangensis]